MPKVRTRFAPSPTGYLHVGGIRTALFAWLLARQKGGQFILRLEDTDKKREVSGSDKHVMESLRTLGLDYDEGPDKGGPFAPYRQSQRLASYKKWAQQLIDAGRAYADPYTAGEVEAFRKQAEAQKQPFLYRKHRPDKPPVWDGSRPLRFKSEPQAYKWHDVVMGDLRTGPEVIDDFILIKSDGLPTYNFAHIIDDAEMQISHIIRGQEFLASIPNYLNLYEALDLKPPLMATMPHVLGKDGQKKLSKRDGAKDVLDYIREGYLPEGLINFIASLGWNDGSEQEVFTVQELIKKFSLERVQRSGAHFDEQRLLWINGAHIRQLSIDDLYQRSVGGEDRSSNTEYRRKFEIRNSKFEMRGFWPKAAEKYPEEYKKQVLGLVQERLKYLAELPQLTNFFFEDLPVDPKLISSHKQLSKLSHNQLKQLLEQAKTTLQQSDFSVNDLTKRLNQLLEQTSQKPAVLFSLIRIATTQAAASPGLAETLAVLGKPVSLRRIDQQLAAL